jgi:hypothetical protein
VLARAGYDIVSEAQAKRRQLRGNSKVLLTKEAAVVSPDGHYLAHVNNEIGRQDVFHS